MFAESIPHPRIGQQVCALRTCAGNWDWYVAAFSIRLFLNSDWYLESNVRLSHSLTAVSKKTIDVTIDVWNFDRTRLGGNLKSGLMWKFCHFRRISYISFVFTPCWTSFINMREMTLFEWHRFQKALASINVSSLSLHRHINQPESSCPASICKPCGTSWSHGDVI